MEQHNMYTLPYPHQSQQPQPQSQQPPRQRSPGPSATNRSSGAYQNSSAFSASANPDEDWTKISDLAERRRIQNRIAQRNYRKKLKRRLEDLEKRTSSSSASPEQKVPDIVRQPSSAMSIAIRQAGQRRASASTAGSSEPQYSPDFPSSDEYWSDLRQPATQQFAYSYPQSTGSSFTAMAPAVEYFPNDYSSSDYTQSNAMYGSVACQPGFVHAASPPLPNMLNASNTPSDSQYAANGMMNSFDVNYASLAGVGLAVPAAAGYASRVNETSFLDNSNPYLRKSRA